MAILAGAAGLLLVLVLGDGLGRNGFAIGHPRQAELDVDAEAAAHAVERDLHVRLAQSGEDRFAAAGVAREAQGGVFFHQPLQGGPHLVEVRLRFGMDRGRVGGAGELDARQGNLP